MSNSINLVTLKNNQLLGEEKWLKIARASALISMIFVASIAILVFVVNLTIPIQSIRNSEQATLADIAALHNRLATYYLTKDRANNLSNIISKRKTLPTSTNEIFNLVPPELSIKSFDADAKNISIVVSGNSLLPINKFIDDVITASRKGKIIKNVSIQELSVDTKHGSYSLSINGKIP